MNNRDFKNIKQDKLALLLQKRIGNTFNDMIGVEILKYEPGYCLSRTAIRPEFLNPLGGLHGGLLYTIADTTAGTSSLHLEEASSVTTINGDLRFFRPALNLDCIYCEAKVIKDGKRIAFAEVELLTEDGTLLAKGCFNFARITLPNMKKIDLSELND